MKRDHTGKFVLTWDEEPKQAVKLSLTQTAWQRLNQQAQTLDISRSELVERYARGLEVEAFEHQVEALVAERTAQLRQENEQLRAHLNQREQELQQQTQAQTDQQQWLEAVLNFLPTPLMLLDSRTGRVVFSNQAADQLAGTDLSSEAVAGTYNEDYHCTDETGQVVPPDQLPSARAARGEVIRGVELTWHNPKGDYWLLVYADTLPAMYERPETRIVVFQDISDRKQMEVQLRDSQRFIQQVADATPGVLYIYDLLEERSVYANRQFGQVLGYPVEEIAALGNQLFVQLMHPDDLETLPAHMERFSQAQDGEVIEREYRMRDAQGEWRWLWSRDLVFARSETGVPQQIIGISHDITERKRAAEALKASEHRYAQILDSVQDMVFCKDPNSEVVYANRAACEYYGLTLEQLKGVTDGPHNQLDVTQQYLQDDLQVFTSGQVVEVLEEPNHCANGEIRYFHTIKSPIFDAAGNVVQLVGVSRDISDRKQAEQALRNSNLRLKLLASTANQLLRTLEPAAFVENLYHELAQHLELDLFFSFLVDDHNPSWLRLNTCAGVAKELIPEFEWFEFGQPVCGLVALQRQRIAVENIQHSAHRNALGLVRLGISAYVAYPLMVGDRLLGTLSFGTKRRLRFADDELDLMQVICDQFAIALQRAYLITDLQQQTDELANANRIKDEFLAVLSHELRTPMNPILGWTQLLRRGQLNSDKATAALGAIERNAKLQVQLIDDLLDVSRILRGSLNLNAAPVTLESIITSAMDTVHLAAEAKAIQIHSQLAPLKSHVLGDETRLQQVVWNLLSNAIKFTPSGGRVDVRLERVERRPMDGPSSLYPPGARSPSLAYAQLTVTDTGQGIQPDFLPYVFDTFRQADSSTTRTFGGLGLGLAIVRHLVELHGGTVSVSSEGTGKGATFVVQLPLLPQSHAALPASISVLPDTGLAGVRVLATDDEPDNLELIRFVLEQAGATVVTAASAMEALEQLRDEPPHILLADLGMPHMDGYALLRQVRSHIPEPPLPAIALTAYASEADQQRTQTAGFQLHLAKPIDPATLVRAIGQVLRQPLQTAP